MLHDIRQFDKKFFPKRYEKHSYITENEFLNGLNTVQKNIIDPYSLEKHSNQSINENSIILTFDDGLKDHLKVAEILNSKNIKGVFFIPFGIIETKNFISSHLIQFLVASANLEELCSWIEVQLIKDKFENGYINNFYISKWKNNLWTKQEVFITRTLREVGNDNYRFKLLQNALKKFFKYDLQELHKNLYLNKKDISNIVEMGHTIGSHGWLSCDLRYESNETINKELTLPMNELKNYFTGNYWLSYANGGCNTLIKKKTKKFGYTCAFGTNHSKIDDFNKNRFDLPRFDATKLNIFLD